MAKKSGLLIFSGICFILIGSALFPHVYYPKPGLRIKKYLYQNVQDRQTQMRQIMARGQFWGENDREMFIEHNRDLQAAISHFKHGNLDRRSLVVVLISIVGTLAGIFYSLKGIHLLRDKPLARKMAKCAFCLWGLYLGLFMWNACVEISFLDYASVELWQMASFYKPDMGDLRYEPLVKSLINFSVTRTAIFAFVWMIFYSLGPLYLLNKIDPKRRC